MNYDREDFTQLQKNRLSEDSRSSRLAITRWLSVVDCCFSAPTCGQLGQDSHTVMERWSCQRAPTNALP